MYRKWMKGMVILAVLLTAMISMSMAACPRANSDYYTGAYCGGVLDIRAPGILANDNRDPGATLWVVNPEAIAINPKYGHITVRADGSFTYEAPEDMNSSTTIGFYYNVTDGKCTTTRHALVKIVVTCKCQVKVPPSPIYYCMPITLEQIRADLIKRGAGCVGCGTPGIIDLRDVNVNALGCYPYYVTGCKGCNEGQGEICLVEPCEAEANDIEMCEGTVNRTQLLDMARRNSSCTGDCSGPDIEIFDVAFDNNGYAIDSGYYTATCHSNACGDVTDRGEIKVWQLCDATAEDIYVCPGTDLDTVKEWARENSSCGDCDDVEPEFHIDVDSSGHVTGGWYKVTCTVGPGCTTTATGNVIVEGCTMEALGVCISRTSFLPAPTAQDILDEGLVSCSCGEPVIYEISFLGYSSEVLQLWHYKAYCQTEHGCIVYNESDFEWGACVACCEAGAPDLEICGGTYTKAEVESMLRVNATCNSPEGYCDENLSIEFNLAEIGGYVSGGSYTITCDPPGDVCPVTKATGKVVTVPCNCTCEPKAPLMCTCINDQLDDSEFIAHGAACEGSNCPTPIIDDSGVVYSKAGRYQYKVYCEEGCEPAIGTVCVQSETCKVIADDYGTGYLMYEGNVIGTVHFSIAYNQMIAELDAADGWTIEDSKMYAGVTAMNDCAPSGWSNDLSIALGSISGWDCGDTLHVNVYARITQSGYGGSEVETCTGDISIGDYFVINCDENDIDSCWSCGC